MENKIEEKLKKEPKSYIYILSITIIVVLFLIWSSFSIKKGENVGDSMSIAKNIIFGILNPDLKFLFRLDKQGVIYLLFGTICIPF